MATLAVAGAVAARRAGVQAVGVYVALGVACWLGLHEAGDGACSWGDLPFGFIGRLNDQSHPLAALPGIGLQPVG